MLGAPPVSRIRSRANARSVASTTMLRRSIRPGQRQRANVSATL